MRLTVMGTHVMAKKVNIIHVFNSSCKGVFVWVTFIRQLHPTVRVKLSLYLSLVKGNHLLRLKRLCLFVEESRSYRNRAYVFGFGDRYSTTILKTCIFGKKKGIAPCGTAPCFFLIIG